MAAMARRVSIEARTSRPRSHPLLRLATIRRRVRASCSPFELHHVHKAKGAGGRGVLCSSDICTVTMDRKFLSFMRSYPNLIPLSAAQVTGIAAALEPFAFDTIYGHYFDRVIPTGGKKVLKISVARYLRAIEAP